MDLVVELTRKIEALVEKVDNLGEPRQCASNGNASKELQLFRPSPFAAQLRHEAELAVAAADSFVTRHLAEDDHGAWSDDGGQSPSIHVMEASRERNQQRDHPNYRSGNPRPARREVSDSYHKKSSHQTLNKHLPLAKSSGSHRHQHNTGSPTKALFRALGHVLKGIMVRPDELQFEVLKWTSPEEILCNLGFVPDLSQEQLGDTLIKVTKMEAVGSTHHNTTKYLFMNGADVDLWDSKGRSALHWVSRKGDIVMV